MILIIVESPAKCKKIEGFLGNNYKCLASYGHIREFSNGLKSIDSNYKVLYKISQNKQKYVKILRAAIKKSTEVILATDDDREGEAIAWHICKVFNLPIKTTKRIIFHEITKKAILKAVNNPTRIDMDKVNAQQTRQILDLVVGFTASPILWKHISRNSKKGLSAGRCQTPALNLVYENEQQCKMAKGEELYETFGTFTRFNIIYKLNKNFKNKENVIEFLEKSKEFKHVLNITGKKRVKKSPPKPFTTSTLQQKASNNLNFSPKNTMKLAQTLYENGFITYMRTDNPKYSKDFIETAVNLISSNWNQKYVGKHLEKITIQSDDNKDENDNENNENDNKDDLAQEAHEAIRPTKLEYREINHPKIGKYEQKLYKLIWENSVESCMSPSMYEVIDSAVTAPDDYIYKNSTQKNIFPGWEIVKGIEKDETIYEYLYAIKDESKEISYNDITSDVAIKKLKSHYTEARIVQLLEKKGIGRPSTFSSLVSKIIDRGYVEKKNIKGIQIDCENFILNKMDINIKKIKKSFGDEKNKLVITPVGIVVIEFLMNHFDNLFNYEYTKNMENNLDKISKGNLRLKKICNDCKKQLSSSISRIDSGKTTDVSNNKKRTKKGIKIDENHEWIIGKYGPVIKCQIDGKTIFKKVKQNLDMEKLKNGEYTLSEIIYVENKQNNNLGKIDDKDVILKKGKFGLYISYDNKNISLKRLNKPESKITIDDVKDIIKNNSSSKTVLKTINEAASIRQGKWGPYVFYKTNEMKKPRFIPIKNIAWKDIGLDWVYDNL